MRARRFQRRRRLAAAVVAATVGLASAGHAAAQVPTGTTEKPTPPAEWQRPTTDITAYTAGAHKELAALDAKVAELRQQANERGETRTFRKLAEVQERLRVAWEKWDKLPQADQANWDTVREDFEMAYRDLMEQWEEVQRLL